MRITTALAMSASKDAGNRSMRKAGRTTWALTDYNRAVAEFDRLRPESDIGIDALLNGIVSSEAGPLT